MAISSLRLPTREVRKHPPSQIAKIQASIEEFGFIGVVIVDADNEVIVGVARVQAAKQAGFDEVPSIRVQHLTKAQLKAYRIADNKIAEDATWDLGEIKLEFDAILELDPEFELEITGFHSAEIDLVMEGDTEASDPADGFDVTPGSIAVSRPGDIWQLGSHRLLCSDAKSPESYAALLDDEIVDQIVSDLPYNVKIRTTSAVSARPGIASLSRRQGRRAPSSSWNSFRRPSMRCRPRFGPVVCFTCSWIGGAATSW